MKTTLSGGIFGLTYLLAISGCSDVTVKPAERRAEAPAQSATQPFSRAFGLASNGLEPSDGFWKSTPRLVDINSDGNLDLLAYPRLTPGVHVWLGDGRGGWQPYPTGINYEGTSCGGGVDVADINRDKRLDLVVADHCRGLFVYLADKSGLWKAVGKQPVSLASKKLQGADLNPLAGSEDVALGDINEDGKLDIVSVASDQGGFSVFIGDGSGKGWKESSHDGLPSFEDPDPNDDQQAGWGMEVLLKDINADGHLDVAASYYKGPRVWLGDGTGKFKEYSDRLPTPSVGGIYSVVALGDFNEDGRYDLVAANDVNGPEVYLQTDHGWSDYIDAFPDLKGGAESVAVGDFDRDGHTDLIVGGKLTPDHKKGNGLFILKGDGTGHFRFSDPAPGLPHNGLKIVWGLAVEDIDKDGWPDFAAETGGTTKVDGEGSSLPHLQVWLSKPGPASSAHP